MDEQNRAGDSSTEIVMPELVEAPKGEAFTPSKESEPLFAMDAFQGLVAKSSALEAFLNISTNDVNYSEFISQILVTFMQVVKCEAGTIFESDPINHSFFCRAVFGSSSDKITNFVIPPGKGIVGHVAESRVPMIVDQLSENEFHLKSVEMAIGFETRNLVALPIVIRGRLYGVLELLNRVGELSFTSADLELLTFLIQMAAKVIEIRLMIAWARNEKENFEERKAA